MMKEILELLLKLGWEVPNWLLILLFVLVVIGVLTLLIKKNVIPIVTKAAKTWRDIISIEEIKNRQSIAIQKSIDGDKELKEDIDELRGEISGIHDKLDQISDTLQSLCDKEEREGMSRAQNRLLEMYKQFYLNNESKTWTRYESEVFNSTLDSYLAHDGNSFIANEVAPKMKLLTVLD